MVLLFNRFGLLDTHRGLIISYLSFSLPCCIYMMRGYLRNIPSELDEAALVDGCNRLQILQKHFVDSLAMGAVKG